MSTGRVVRIVLMMLLALSLSSWMIAAEKSKLAHPGNGGAWACVDAEGGTSLATSPLTSNGNRSWVIDYVGTNSSDGSLSIGKGEGFMTGPDTFENYNVLYYRYPDGSLAYIVITRGKGRNVGTDQSVMQTKGYVFVPALVPFTDADGNGVPDDFREALMVVEIPSTCSRLSSLLSSFPAPDEYPEEPNE